MSVLQVEDIAKDEDLQDEVGGLSALVLIEPELEVRNAARQAALGEVEESLMGRSPPVAPGELSDPAQLKGAVVFGALMRMCFNAMTVEGSVHQIKGQHYAGRFKGALARSFALKSAASSPSGGSFRMERR